MLNLYEASVFHAELHNSVFYNKHLSCKHFLMANNFALSPFSFTSQRAKDRAEVKARGLDFNGAYLCWVVHLGMV